MKNPLITLIQILVLSRRKELHPTQIMPLTQIRKATVFLDSFDADAEPTRKEITNFLHPYGIDIRFICPQKWDLTWYGKLKKQRLRKGEMPSDMDDDLFLSLACDDNFAAECEARESHAKFKVGRVPLKGNVYDIVITNAADTLPRQTEAWKAIKEYLLKIE